MGRHFGNIAKVSGIVTYTLSPFEQRAFANAIKKGVPNMIRRIREQIFIVAPPFVLAYLVYDYATKEHHRLMTKAGKADRKE
ncbi:hypothetical protein CHS0354_000107 [Potamilus streckersoni]|uniref:Cytochrome b-c1 complex subunit 8 n=1 Tax=Potamilus streckersoni TaxID=2493646 RepID=A0AAE0WFD4_9BIVA|nr:hypothetical protein CHS0354_000107 [Potamilus streckersoni]